MARKLLHALAERAGRVLAHERLLELVSGSAEEAFDRSIDVHVSRLRAKLGDDPRKPRLLKTVPLFPAELARLRAAGEPLQQRHMVVAADAGLGRYLRLSWHPAHADVGRRALGGMLIVLGALALASFPPGARDGTADRAAGRERPPSGRGRPHCAQRPGGP
jgi:hypothetical protein